MVQFFNPSVHFYVDPTFVRYNVLIDNTYLFEHVNVLRQGANINFDCFQS